MRHNQKLLSLILTMCIAMSMFNGYAPANAVTIEPAETVAIESAEVDSETFVLPDIIDSAEAEENRYIGRVESAEKDLSTFVFANEDGTNTMRVYSHPVKYVAEDGAVRDIKLDVEAKSDGAL